MSGKSYAAISARTGRGARFRRIMLQCNILWAAMSNSSISDTIQRALSSAGLDTRSGLMKGVGETIQRALAAAGIGGSTARHDTARPVPQTLRRASIEDVIDVPVRVVPPFHEFRAPSPAAAEAPQRGGRFITRSYSNAAGTRSYKLYVPTHHGDKPMPLVVMLHGCTQNPDDFAAGTQMNALAERHGFLVAYPAQSANANGQHCWNWFKTQDQARDAGEPSLIAGITREIAAAYSVDPQRIFVAGLSAGAAMAVILGVTYPELYAAVGAHSGLPYGAAHDMPSAFAAMQGSGQPKRAAMKGVPTIVFHGDRDTTVNTGNAMAVVNQATESVGLKAPLTRTVHARENANGRDFTRTVYTDPAGHSRVEQWLLHGAAHAWSGGSPAGSYADPTGPDASAEMFRFFLAQKVS